MKDKKLKFYLESQFRVLCDQRKLSLESLSVSVYGREWQIDATIAKRIFSFGTEYRDGYVFGERKGDDFMLFDCELHEPIFVPDDKALLTSADMIVAALSDPGFRGEKPWVI